MSKKLVGGVILLCLTTMALTLSEDGETYTNITQPEILEQLTNLKNYISNPYMIKPVWVQLNNGDEIVVVQGELKVVDTGEFEICVQLNGYKLVISIEFTQATLEDDTPIDDWYIDENDAKYLFTTNAQEIGAISELPIFENIVDKNGHKRFIEGNITLAQSIDGITLTYGKWSLSGSHLMIVIALSVTNETSITNGMTFGRTVELPEWIYNKIVPVWATTYVIRDSASFLSNDWSFQNSAVMLSKSTNNQLVIVNGTDVTFTADRNCRIAFDLLIDNVAPETQGE